jgi:hypothetical protein
MVLLTSFPRDDGFGAQFQTILCAALFAELNGHEFAYTSPYLSHLYSKEEVDEIEQIMNFKGKYIDATGAEPKIDIRHSYNFIEGNIDHVLASQPMKKIRGYFKENKTNPFDPGTFNVAIHIRRPSTKPTIDLPIHNEGWGDTKSLRNFDVDQTNRLTRNGHFLDTIDSIRKTHPGAKFHIFSDGVPEIFECFKADDTTLYLSTSLTHTYTCMLYADILVTCKSSFSYVPALLRDHGEVYYTPFWHKPASSWKIL